MYLLGIDLGTSSIKISLIESNTHKEVASVQYPDSEADIISLKAGWAEQDPETWWSYTKSAILKLKNTHEAALAEAKAIGISYQMHGLVMVDEKDNVLRNSIIWCDSRAVEIGEKAFKNLGSNDILPKLLNSPGNFTASKLAWVKENEPENYAKCKKVMLPGDFLSLRLCGNATTTPSGLSEGIFWDFETNTLSEDILKVYGFDKNLIPEIKPTFSSHGKVLSNIASELGLNPEAEVTYKAGDQPNNALSLNVLNPGEIAATAGTSGVVYAVSDQIKYDADSRINSFAHVNHSTDPRIGILLCINGTGILNRWVKDQFGANMSYNEINALSSQVPIGSAGISVLPFGNGAERMLKNQFPGAQFKNINFNIHTKNHVFRAAQEGIVFSLAYGFEMMKNLGVVPAVIRAGQANMFLSDVFTQTMVNTTQVAVETYDTNGAKGAALGAGYGKGIYNSLKEAMAGLIKIKVTEPNEAQFQAYEDAYGTWKKALLSEI